MQIIGLEEHVVVPELLPAWSRLPGFQATGKHGFGDGPLAQQYATPGMAAYLVWTDQASTQLLRSDELWATSAPARRTMHA